MTLGCMVEGCSNENPETTEEEASSIALLESAQGFLVKSADECYKKHWDDGVEEYWVDACHPHSSGLPNTAEKAGMYRAIVNIFRDTFEDLKENGIPFEGFPGRDKSPWNCTHVHIDNRGLEGVFLGMTIDAEYFDRLFPNYGRQSILLGIPVREFNNEDTENWTPDGGKVQKWGNKYIVALDITDTLFGYELLMFNQVPKAIQTTLKEFKA